MIQAGSATVVNRESMERTSPALWIPIVWLFIAGSRPISLWFVGGHLDDPTNVFLEGSPFDRNILTALILGALIVLFGRQRRLAAVAGTIGPFLLFVLYCAVSILWSDFPDVAFKRWIRLLGDLSMMLVIVTERFPATAVKVFLQRAGLILLPASIVMDCWRIATGRNYEMYMGLTTNKNMYGTVALVLGLGGLWRLVTSYRTVERKGRFRRLFPHLCIAGMAVWCLSVAHSMTCIACTVIGFTILLITNVWSSARKSALLHFVLGSIIFAVVYASVLNPDVGVVTSVGKDPTLTYRTDVWREVGRLASANPLRGAGFESFWLGSRLKEMCTIFVWCPNESHNGYLEVYANLGWMGIAVLGFVIVAGYVKAVRLFRTGTDIGSLVLTCFVAALIYNISEAGFRINTMVWLMFLLSLTAASIIEAAPATSHRTPQPEATQEDARQLISPATVL